MANEFRGTGVVATAPTLKTVSVAGQARKVAELRVFFDDYKPNGYGGFEQSGFWLDVSVCGDALANSTAHILHEGDCVHVIGRLSESKWNVQGTGKERRALQLNADSVFYGLTGVENAHPRARRDAADTVAK